MTKPLQKIFFNKELWIYRFFWGLLFFAIIHKPADLSAQTGMVISDDALVYESKISSLNISENATSITLDGAIQFKTYLLLNNQEVLTGSNVQFTIPTLNYQAQMIETDPGIYSLSDQVFVTFNNPYTMLSRIDQWQIEPLSYFFGVGDQIIINETGVFPISIAAVTEGFKTFVNKAGALGYVRNADVGTIVSVSQDYQVNFIVDLHARLLDETRTPLANQTFEATLDIPAHNYSKVVTITTDSEGIFSYAWQESAVISAAGGNLVALSSPLNIDGISFVSTQEIVTLMGAVTQRGLPLPGAALYMNGNPVVYTDQAGIYKGEVGPGTGTITAYTASGEFIEEKTVSLTAGEMSTADFDFNPRVIKGKVTKNGVALSGARIWAGRNKVVLTDSQGDYSTNVQGEKIEISAFTTTGEFINQQIVNNGIDNLVNFDFQPAFVAGIVREDGSPLENAKVYAQFNEPVFTNVSGEYSFEAKPGPTRVVAYTIADEFIGEKMVTLVNGETVAVHFDFSPVSIAGTVSEGGAAVPMAQVYVGANMPVTADAIGRYTTRVQSGTWKVFAENAFSNQIGETTIQVAPPNAVTVNVP